jgi:hypothetical protein
MKSDKLENIDLAELESVTGGDWYWKNGTWHWTPPPRNRGLNNSGRGDTANRRRR